jgi:hypothetical protein
MISKKWRKLEKQLIEENEKNNDNLKEDNNEKKEIIIVDINNNIEEDNADKDVKNNSKMKLSKPNPIIKVDTSSLNMTDYKINNNERNNNYLNDNNYCRLFNSSLNQISRNYNINKYNCYPYFNKQNYRNYNDLAKSNDYTYFISSKNSPLSENNNFNAPYRLNRTNSYTENKMNNNKNNSNIRNLKMIYNYTLQEKPNKMRSMSYRKLTDNNYNDKKDDNAINDYLSVNKKLKNSFSNYSENNYNYYPKEKRMTYSLNNDYIRDIIMKYKNRNKDYNDSQLFKLNYKYI